LYRLGNQGCRISGHCVIESSRALQGKGLGRPLINYGIKTLIELDGNDDIYIHTQTWNYTAIALYLKEGFRMMKEETFGGYKNDFNMSFPLLRQKLHGLLV
jgi:ribosomal protein S18 acetylase RimI-like enzyme